MSPTALTLVPTVAAGAPALDQAHAPASVRDGSKAVKQAYETAQGFEEMLLQQLSQSLVQSSGLTGEGDVAGEASSEEGVGGGPGGGGSMLTSLLPQTLAEGVMREGGLGIATQLMGALDPAATTGAIGQTGGVSVGGSASGSGGVAATTGAIGQTEDASAPAVAPTGGVSA
ncbi:MAG TPA: hypothetical protein VNY52_02300 [Solirubrobacteraceae bacterium]|nr:hypothetical protein [Solirubrobacteraceae bacterium]